MFYILTDLGAATIPDYTRSDVWNWTQLAFRQGKAKQTNVQVAWLGTS
jgi:hypothetical protein